MKSKIITIDGPVASGKTELCRRLSDQLKNWDWLSTGVFYRGLAYMVTQSHLNHVDQWVDCIQNSQWEVKKATKQTHFFYKEKDITSLIYNLEMDQKASQLAACTEVRKAFIEYQRNQKEPHRGLMAEGRDCGTAIFPDATLKIYLTASLQVRAKRRAKERDEKEGVVIDAQKKRDKSDSERPFNPLKKPKDAWVIETDSYSIQAVTDMVYKKAHDIFKI